MPDPVPTLPPTSGTPTPLSTPPGSTAGSGAPEAWRAPASSGRFAGKSAEEVLGIAAALADIVQNGNGGAPAPTPEPVAFDVADDEYVSGAQFKRLMAERRPDNTAVDLAASANVGITQQRFAQDFAKYGPEINAMIARVPAGMRTLDNLAQVVKMVQADHLDEIVRERANTLASNMEPTLRSNGAAAPLAPVVRDQSLESDKIPADWKQRALKAGVTERVVEEFCRANDMSPEAFYKQFDTPLNKIVEDVSSRAR